MKIQKSGRGVEIRIADNAVDIQVMPLSWEQLETLVREGKRLLDERSVPSHCGLTEQERQEAQDDADSICVVCGHSHTGECPPADPCGSYLCCIN